jgi:hypothetical protein
MREIAIAVVGLILGAAGALAYSHFLGDGRELAELRARVDDLQANLASIKQRNQKGQQETQALTEQVQQLASTKDALQKQVDDFKGQAATTATAPKPLPSNFMSNMIKAHMDQQREQRFQLLKERLHLTPEQAAALKAAMDAESKFATDAAAAMMSGGKIDTSRPPGFKSVDQTLNDMLSPDQKTAYEQLKTDEKNSSAETLATFQMNQVAPMLQLNDSQKDQMVSALEQVQLNASDPAWIKSNVTNSADPTSILEAQQKARNDALAKILSPEQLNTYEQQAQSQLDMQRQMMQQFHPGTSAPAAAGTSSAPASASP